MAVGDLRVESTFDSTNEKLSNALEAAQ